MRREYLTFSDGWFNRFGLRDIVRMRRDREGDVVWSARLSSGLFGLVDCSAGNRGPNGTGEVIFASGDEGLRFLIGYGFIPCPVCKPENSTGFWQSAEETVKELYEFENVVDFSNKDIVPFDARRVFWEGLLPLLKTTPNRLYLPRGLVHGDLIELRNRFGRVGFELPPVGYYDKDAPGRFFEYRIE